jgi:PKD repeat protein
MESASAAGRIRLVALLLVATALVVLLVHPTAAQAADGDIGYRGLSYTGTTTPTGSKPESKLWWNDGSWWASMFDSTSQRFYIFRLDRSTQTWVNTGVPLDERTNTKADTLWDGSHLYVASHVAAASSSTAVSGYPSRLYRFSYDAGSRSYSLNAGFPVAINNVKSETLVVDKDATGKLWASWTQFGQVMVNRTTGGDGTWGTPFVLPVTGATGLDADDISSVVAFGGNKVGVMWSNQPASAMYFSLHADGQPDSTWETSRTAIQGPKNADDHINLKSLQADSSGRVFAAVKTSMDDQPSPPQNAPLIMLLVRDPATGDWASHVFGRIADSHTRPIVLLDQEHNLLHMFATGPSTPGTIAYSGTIYEKTSPLDDISFVSGVGTPVIRDVTSADMNNVTSTKQNVNSTTGLVVLASNDITSRYWHADESLATTAPTAPTASFTAAPTSGVAPLSVAFTDTSTGSPTSWSWAFGDGGTSSAQNPAHTYTAAGTYTVSLTATNAAGSDTTTRTGYVTVTAPVPTQTFAPSADSYVNSVSPGKNYGTLDVLKVRQGTSSSDTTWRSYLQFNVIGVTGPVTSVKLRLYVTDSSVDGGEVYAVSNSWTEAGLTWNNAPVVGGTPLAQAGAVTTGAWAEIDLGAAAVSGNGTYSFALKNAVTNTALYNSREAASNPPQLIVTQS